MSGLSNTKRSIIAAVAALLMSTVAVGAAVGPAQVFHPDRKPPPCLNLK